MDAARKERQRIAVESLMLDPLTRQIYAAFLSKSQSLSSFTVEDVLQDDQFRFHKDAYDFFVANNELLLPTLRDSLADFSIVERPRSILDTAAVDQEKRYVFQVNTIEEIPKQFRSDARALPNGKYRIVGDSTLATAMMGETVPGGEKPVDKPPVADPKLFQISRAAMASGDITAYRELSELAAKQGKVVKIID
jgi:hypothetical protein